jgi:hypothetical protein
MQLSNPKQIINLDDFLPSDGETRFEMFFSDGVLNLDIFYETADFESRDARRRIRFSQAKYFFKTPFPGYSFFSCPDDRELSLLNSLVEYEHSDMLEMECGASKRTDYRHYRLFLHSTGVAIHVIAQSCEISNEELVG